MQILPISFSDKKYINNNKYSFNGAVVQPAVKRIPKTDPITKRLETLSKYLVNVSTERLANGCVVCMFKYKNMEMYAKHLLDPKGRMVGLVCDKDLEKLKNLNYTYQAVYGKNGYNTYEHNDVMTRYTKYRQLSPKYPELMGSYIAEGDSKFYKKPINTLIKAKDKDPVKQAEKEELIAKWNASKDNTAPPLEKEVNCFFENK
ncbi:MAG: hypothetical protein MJ231_04650 [bacterium]|nr:hypothetical protein [bacterium]